MEAAAKVKPTEKSGGQAATQLRTALKVHIDLDEIVRKHRVRVIEDKIYVGRGGTSIFAWIRTHAMNLEKRAQKMQYHDYMERFMRDTEPGSRGEPPFREEQERLGRNKFFVRDTLEILRPGVPGPELAKNVKFTDLPDGWEETVERHLAGEIHATNAESRTEKKTAQSSLSQQFGEDLHQAKKAIARTSVQAKGQAKGVGASSSSSGPKGS